MIKTNKRILQIICILLLMALILICNNHEVEAAGFAADEYCMNKGLDYPSPGTVFRRCDHTETADSILVYMHLFPDRGCSEYYVWNTVDGGTDFGTPVKPANYQQLYDKANAAITAQENKGNNISINTPQNRRFCL